jgi:hypothetical protein
MLVQVSRFFQLAASQIKVAQDLCNECTIPYGSTYSSDEYEKNSIEITYFFDANQIKSFEMAIKKLVPIYDEFSMLLAQKRETKTLLIDAIDNEVDAYTISDLYSQLQTISECLDDTRLYYWDAIKLHAHSIFG